MPPLRDATIKLPDGRRLAYTEWGHPDGPPVMCFHGSPGTRLWPFNEEQTADAGVRLIMPDRPGIGRSDPQPGRTFADWPENVEALADALEITTFGVVGVSAGGPYAAACAALIPGRLTGVALVASRALKQYNWGERPEAKDELSPEEREEFDVAQKDPAAAADLAAEHGREYVDELVEHPEIIQKMLDNEGAEGDAWFFEDPLRKQSFEESCRDWARQGLDAIKWEFIDVYLPWGFRLADITMPVSIWCGAQDPRVDRMEYQAQTIPSSTLTIWPDGGHLAMVKHWREILEAVV